jgi:putative transposase
MSSWPPSCGPYWHNTARGHSYLGDLPPAEIEAAFYDAQRNDQSLVEIQ